MQVVCRLMRQHHPTRRTSSHKSTWRGGLCPCCPHGIAVATCTRLKVEMQHWSWRCKGRRFAGTLGVASCCEPSAGAVPNAPLCGSCHCHVCLAQICTCSHRPRQAVHVFVDVSKRCIGDIICYSRPNQSITVEGVQPEQPLCVPDTDHQHLAIHHHRRRISDRDSGCVVGLDI